MSRQPKKGLAYFPKDVDYYDDDKIMDLLMEYGPLGQTIYDVILCYVYKNGYYLELPLDKLATLIVRIVGNRWIKEKNLVLQVIHYCAEIGLFDKDLLSQNVITSAGIQNRYSEVTVRNKVNKEKYWLLENEKKSTAVISATFSPISATETAISATEMNITATEMQQSKVNKIKEKESKVNVCPRGTYGHVNLTEQEYDDLCKLYMKDTVNNCIESVDAYLHKKPNVKPYDSHYQTILDWLEKDGADKKSNHSYDIDKMFEIAMTTSPFGNKAVSK